MGRKNRRSRTEYRSRLGFNPRKYTNQTYTGGITGASVPFYPASAGRNPLRGDIWFADLGCHPGTSVQGGCRPVMVISNNIGNANAGTFNVLPLTRHLKKPNLPCHTVIETADVTDKHQHLDDSMLLAEQITTIGVSQLRSYVGRVEDAELLTQIAGAVFAQLGLDGIHGIHSIHGAAGDATGTTETPTATEKEENETI